MTAHTPTLLLLFVLASCFYKRHVTNWRSFHWGVIALVCHVGMLTSIEILSSSLLFVVVDLCSSGLQIVAILALVRACTSPREALAELRCLKCGYVLKGLKEPRCSECGWRI